MSPLSLPIIDITPFLDLSQAAHKPVCAQQIRTACRDVGFFYLTGHGVPPELMKDVLDVSREFFALPEEEKQLISIANNDKARGYQRLGENVTKYFKDWHEVRDPLLYAYHRFPSGWGGPNWDICP